MKGSRSVQELGTDGTKQTARAMGNKSCVTETIDHFGPEEAETIASHLNHVTLGSQMAALTQSFL